MERNARSRYVTRSLHLLHIASQVGWLFCSKVGETKLTTRKNHSTKRVAGENLFIPFSSIFYRGVYKPHPFLIGMQDSQDDAIPKEGRGIHPKYSNV